MGVGVRMREGCNWRWRGQTLVGCCVVARMDTRVWVHRVYDVDGHLVVVLIRGLEGIRVRDILQS